MLAFIGGFFAAIAAVIGFLLWAAGAPDALSQQTFERHKVRLRKMKASIGLR